MGLDAFNGEEIDMRTVNNTGGGDTPHVEICELLDYEIDIVSGGASHISDAASVAGIALSVGGVMMAVGTSTGPVSFGIGFGVAVVGLFVSAAGYAASKAAK